MLDVAYLSDARWRQAWLLAVLTIVVGGGCGPTATASKPPSIRSTGETPSALSANSQDVALSDILAGVGDSGITATLTEPADEFNAPSGATWMRFDMPSPDVSSDPIVGLRPEFAVDLVAGALKDVSAANKFSPVYGFSIYPPGGADLIRASVIGQLSPEDVGQAPDDGKLAERITGNAARLGLQVNSILFLHPLGTAAIVEASTDKATGILDNASLVDVFGDLADYDGVMLVVDDPKGPAAVTFFTSRIQESYVWARADVGNVGDAVGPPDSAGP